MEEWLPRKFYLPVLHSDIDKIKLTLENIDQKAFDLAVETILAARKIYVVGIRSCAPLASFLTFYLNLICEDVAIGQYQQCQRDFRAADPDWSRRCDYRNQLPAGIRCEL